MNVKHKSYQHIDMLPYVRTLYPYILQKRVQLLIPRRQSIISNFFGLSLLEYISLHACLYFPGKLVLGERRNKAFGVFTRM